MAVIKNSVAGSGYGSAYVDSLVWGRYAWDPASGPISYYFGAKADFNAALTAHGASEYLTSGAAAQAWKPQEIKAFVFALSNIERVCSLTFVPAASVAKANMVWWKADLGDEILGAHELPAAGQIWGYFNPTFTASWNNLSIGGDGLYVITHEIGHGLGLAHPHDGGGEADATRFPGVDSPGDIGSLGLNQSIWTAMSYNRGWSEAPYSTSFGGQGGLGTFDIAALQALYGANMSAAPDNDTYLLPSRNTTGTGWSSIWDTGGTDTISGLSAEGEVTIDLRAASLVQGDPNAGGYASQQWDIGGGFTIANGVTIENAYGGSWNDRLIGNDAANLLRGYAGDDVLRGFGGNDILQGYAGDDELIGDANNDTLSGGLGNDTLKGGAGRDIFIFSTKPNIESNRDKIADFNVRDDTIWLDDKVFTKIGKGTELKPGKLNKKFFTFGEEARDRDDHVIYDKMKGVLHFDPDGSGPKKAVDIATLTKKLALTIDDFRVI
ncbi:M10 family metallopeptidase C-terminal domain-containing protein [Microvirga sp. 2TAF3]|uniref:M10 family metallopeptidase C-terminal domain-containing protein n=1 Tax=Microvirga sp. 2TAF3 TaxID=3233014 RepID=UPI003F9BA8F6